MKTVLTIAGSDCSGGAGIQADLKTMAAMGCYGMSVITAVTVQNTCGVKAVYPMDAHVVREQFDAVVSDIYPDAIKIGMLCNEEIIEVVSAGLEKIRQKGEKGPWIGPGAGVYQWKSSFEAGSKKSIGRKIVATDGFGDP